MTITLPTKPGLTPSAVHTIPEQWGIAWFRRFIRDFLQGADVRSAIAGPGISITGNLASPYATISLAAPLPTSPLFSGTITTAKLTAGGTNGSMTFSNGILSTQVAAT